VYESTDQENSASDGVVRVSRRRPNLREMEKCGPACIPAGARPDRGIRARRQRRDGRGDRYSRRAVTAAPGDSDLLYEAATVFATAAATDKGAAAERWAGRALELLRQAHAAGFLAPAGMRRLVAMDQAFNALRSRDDFRRFVDSLPNPVFTSHSSQKDYPQSP
jgi:hypothetical protein